MSQLDTPKVPHYLKHKPIYEINNYALFDGPYAGDSDAIGLSIGLAQWTERGTTDISAKVWRHTRNKKTGFEGGKWSRQSEELPLHRVLDLSLFVCKIMTGEKDFFVQGNQTVIEESADNEYFDDDMKILKEYLEENKEIMDLRFKALAKELKKMGY